MLFSIYIVNAWMLMTLPRSIPVVEGEGEDVGEDVWGSELVYSIGDTE